LLLLLLQTTNLEASASKEKWEIGHNGVQPSLFLVALQVIRQTTRRNIWRNTLH